LFFSHSLVPPKLLESETGEAALMPVMVWESEVSRTLLACGR
jgi:hypothetical protein